MFIYVIGPSEGSIKVGLARSVSSRLRQLQTGNPERLIVHYSVDLTDIANPFAIEKSVHSRLCDYRAAGEWFSCSVATAKGAVDDAINDLGELPFSVEDKTESIKARISQSAKAAIESFAKENGVGSGTAIELLLMRSGLWEPDNKRPHPQTDADAESVYLALLKSGPQCSASVLARKKGVGTIPKKRFSAAILSLLDSGKIVRVGGGKRSVYAVAKHVAE